MNQTTNPQPLRRVCTPWDHPLRREPRPEDLEVLELSEFLSLPLSAARRVYAVVEA